MIVDKTALRSLAITARKKLEETIKQKAYTFGITENEIKPLTEATNPLIVNGRIIREREQKQYDHLKNRIQVEGYQKIMDEAVYTWFNRLVAMRYMEVNGFLPIHTRVLSSKDSAKFEPDALTDILSFADDLEMDKEFIYQLQDENRLNDLYQYLLVRLSDTLGEIIPNVFDPITDDLALLLPDNLLNENSVIRDFVTLVEDEDWKEVEIIGWLYQFYISEEKDDVFANLKKNKKIGKKEIGPATQLFTPRWIVEYMVDNSLGRLWLESHPDESVKETLEYYLEDAEQPEEVNNKLEELTDPNLDVEKIFFLDPSCGSGHILIYAFEVFYTLYESRGYLKHDIPNLILENNLYGLDIDKRAAQLATFSVIMKAREYDRRLFRRDFKVHIHSIEESNSITKEQIQQFSEDNNKVKENVEILIETFRDAKLYGAILQVPDINIEVIQEQIEFIKNESSMDLFTTELIDYAFPIIEDLINQYKLLASQYEVVVTNPPYMGNRGMDSKLKGYVKKYYPDEKSDLFAIFMEVTKNFTKENYYTATINQHSWMFLSSFEKLREKLLNRQTIINMIHLGTRTFEEIGGEVVQNTAFILQNIPIKDYSTQYIRMVDIKNAEEKRNNFLNKELYYTNTQNNFSKIPGSPIAYWWNNKMFKVFDNSLLNNYGSIQEGLKTGDNNTFIRKWFEVSITSTNIFNGENPKWFKHTKGGSFRKWYGNNEDVVIYENNGAALKQKNNSSLTGEKNYFNKNITWTRISSNKVSFRFTPNGSIPNMAGLAMYPNKGYKYILGYLNTKLVNTILNVINPTLNYPPGSISNLPIIIHKKMNDNIEEIVSENIKTSKNDWDSFETSWDFEEHPFLTYKDNSSLIEDDFNKWEEVAEERFYQLKENEEELNRIFIDIYGLQDELTPDVEEKDVTVNKADKERDVKSFLSYLVGLMFGRYSLDQKGLAYAGGEWDDSLFTTYQPDEDDIIPMTQEAYLEDDIVKRVEDLLTIIYGEETLEENLTFIAEALNKKKNESPRERIRRYFMKDFYKDHLKTYQKRPIYWQFSSGRRGAFKGLMYLHRYNKDTIARLRTDYILKEVQVLENLAELEEQVVDDESSSKTQKARAQKNIENFAKDREEIAKYEKVVDHVAKQRIDLDLDDGVKVNHAKFQDIELADDQSSSKKKKQHIFDKI